MAAKVPQTLSGIVTAFQGNGRKFGYPTANFYSDTDLADGVYFGFSDLAEYKHQPTLIFIGTPTTVGDSERRVESHLLDIEDKDYYNLPISTDIQHFYRSNETFVSVEALLAVMKNDEQQARIWFAQQN